MEINNCKKCGKEFNKTRKDRVFCSRECSKNGVNRKYNYVCKKPKEERALQIRLAKYKITTKDYEELVKTFGNVCGICGKPAEDNKNKTLCIDHCHTTNEVRGLLCNSCNLALGLLNDDIKTLESAIKYLQKKSPLGVFP